MNITNLIDNMCIDKKIYLYLLIVLIIGIFLMLTSNNENNISKETNVNINSDNDYSINSYSEFEQKLCNTLSKISGVGEVEIFINYNTEASDIENNKTKSVFGVTDSVRKEREYDNIEGIIIVAQGGDNAEVINLLRNTVSNVLGIALHKVDVLKMR